MRQIKLRYGRGLLSLSLEENRFAILAHDTPDGERPLSDADWPNAATGWGGLIS